MRSSWAWGADFTFQQSKIRDFLGGDLRNRRFDGSGLRLPNDPGLPSDELVPSIYGRRLVTTTLSAFFIPCTMASSFSTSPNSSLVP